MEILFRRNLKPKIEKRKLRIHSILLLMLSYQQPTILLSKTCTSHSHKAWLVGGMYGCFRENSALLLQLLVVCRAFFFFSNYELRVHSTCFSIFPLLL